MLQLYDERIDMSLDVYLTVADERLIEDRIFIRENGANRPISRAEWDRRFPDRAPVVVPAHMTNDVYAANITANLHPMAAEAGVYAALWEPHQCGMFQARDLIAPLRDGLARLKGDPEHFKRLNPKSGWGDYDGLVAFVTDYLAACEQHPAAAVSVWS